MPNVTASLVEELTREHTAFRAKLEALEAALQLDVRAWVAARALCVSLVHGLSDHRRREADLIASCPAPLSARSLARLAPGHGEEFQGLQAVLRYFATRYPSDGMAPIAPVLQGVSTQCRVHMAAQERRLFPVLEWLERLRMGTTWMVLPHGLLRGRRTRYSSSRTGLRIGVSTLQRVREGGERDAADRALRG